MDGMVDCGSFDWDVAVNNKDRVPNYMSTHMANAMLLKSSE